MSREDVIHDDLLQELVCDLLASGREASFIARGSSMHPIIRDGDKVVVRPVDADRLRPGMVALYLAPLPEGGYGMVLHRYLGREENGDLRLRGDACPFVDPPVAPDTVIGQVVAVQSKRFTLRAGGGAGRWLLGRSVRLPRMIVGLARFRHRLRGRVPLPLISLPPGRLLRARTLFRMALGDEEALMDMEEAEEPMAFERGEEELVPLLLLRARRAMLEPHAFDADARRSELAAGWHSAKAEAALRWLHGALAAAGAEALLVKGAALAWERYPEPHVRPLADIDCLVRPEHRERAVEALLAAGAALAEPEYALPHYLRFKNEVALRPPGRDWPVVELHWRGPSSPFYNRRCRIERFWEGTHDSVFGPSLRVMTTESEFAFGILHLAKHFPRLRLLWAVDLALLARAKPDWELVSTALREDRAGLPGAVLCRWLEDLAPRILPDGFADRLAQHASASVGRTELYLFARQDGLATRLSEAASQPTVADRLGYLRRIVLPERRTLERMFPANRDEGLLRLQALRFLRMARGNKG